MKIKNFVTYGSLALSTLAFITIIHNQKYNEAKFENQQNTIISLEQEIDSLEEEREQLQEQIDNISLEGIIEKLEDDIQKELEETNIKVNYFKDEESLIIAIEDQENNKEYELSNEFYYKLNQLIICGNVRKLLLVNLGDEIDFSKLNISNMKKIILDYCRETFDCSAFTQKYDSISFRNLDFCTAVSFIQTCDCSNAIVNCVNVPESNMDKFIDMNILAHILIENDICMKELNVQQWSYIDDSLGLKTETIEALAQVNTKKLSIISAGYEESIDFTLALHPNVEDLRLCLPKSMYSWVSGVFPNEFHNVKIQSDSTYLNIKFQIGTITDETHFELPSSSFITFEEVDFNSIQPFYDLENVKMVIYDYPDISQTFNYNEETHIVHNTEHPIEELIDKLRDYHDNPQKIYQSTN